MSAISQWATQQLMLQVQQFGIVSIVQRVGGIEIGYHVFCSHPVSKVVYFEQAWLAQAFGSFADSIRLPRCFPTNVLCAILDIIFVLCHLSMLGDVVCTPTDETTVIIFCCGVLSWTKWSKAFFAGFVPSSLTPVMMIVDTVWPWYCMTWTQLKVSRVTHN